MTCVICARSGLSYALCTNALTKEAFMAPEQNATWPLARTLAWIVMLVMVAALAYTGWVAIMNFSRIGV